MLHEIGDKKYHCEYVPREPEPDSDYLLSYDANRILLVRDRIPKISEVTPAPDPCSLQFLFTISGVAFFLDRKIYDGIDGYEYGNIRLMRSFTPDWLAFAAVTGYHLYMWYSHTVFCPRCAAKLVHKSDERAMLCPECGNIIYPSIAVAIIVGIRNGNKLLLSRYAGREHTNYALIAGFVEIGEALEDAVRREVAEEVGLKVKNIRYFSNQPWGFSQNILVGFFADLDGSADITIDRNELQEALWMDRDLIPPGHDVSLTSKMMETFRLGLD